MVNDEGQPYHVSLQLCRRANVKEILDQVNTRNIRSDTWIRGIDDIAVWQVSRNEVAFNEKAAETKIDLDLDHATPAKAIKAVQIAARANLASAFPMLQMLTNFRPAFRTW